MKPGRNDPCPCGSGKKFKHCCEGKVQPLPASPAPAELGQLVMLFNTGRHAELESRVRPQLKQQPNSGIAWKLFGLALLMQGKEALPALQKTVQLLPNDAEAHSNLAGALRDAGQLEDAVASCRRAIQIRPDYAEAHNNLANVLKDLGQFDEAVASYRRALALKPAFAAAHNNLGVALQALNKFDEAVTSYRRALEIDPNFVEAHNNLGGILGELGQLDDAVLSYRRALAIKPDYAEAHSNLANILKDLGQYDQAVIGYRRALHIEPDFSDAHSNLLFSLNYTAHVTPADYLAEARRYGQMVSKKVTARFTAWQGEKNPERLRVGLVSGDLREHSVGHFLESLLAHIDPAKIELIAYPTLAKEDALTARIKPHFAAWKPLLGLGDAAAARMIHADGIHVLFDLTGHTAHNRLPLFAWKPAPIQVTWLGYVASTGMAEMDYILGDQWMLPPEEAHHFVEKGWRLSGAHSCLTPPEENIMVETLPALRNKWVTFGTLNNLAKMNDQVVACWARILNKIPDSRLYLNSRNLLDQALRKSIIARYAAHGIAENRLALEATSGRAAALSSYNQIDIALDPFPYPGGTSSYEALWMGVPILTMRGSNYLSHLGESIMHHAGLADWIAADEDDYVAKAIYHTANLQHLATLRAGLRQQVLSSPLFDAPRFARDFEEALWGMWRNDLSWIRHAQPASSANN